MRIEQNDFIMESTFPDNTINNTWFFDLQLKRIIKGKNGDREEFKLEGYSCTTPDCLKIITDFRFDKPSNTTDKKEIYETLLDDFKKLNLKLKLKC